MLSAGTYAATAVASIAGTVALGAGAADGLPFIGDSPFGWLGSILLPAVAAFAAWRAGELRAWKGTAEARRQRIDDLEGELVEARSEEKVLERVSDIVSMMATEAERSDKRAQDRLDGALKILAGQHDANIAHLDRMGTALSNLNDRVTSALDERSTP